MTKIPPYQVILFDLDGTLIDSAEGIIGCITYALQGLGVAVPDATTLRGWIGPPLLDSFVVYLRDRDMAEQALALYRERFAPVGLFESCLYPGVPAMLVELEARGCRLFLATGKPVAYATRILEHFQVRQHFARVGGLTFDGRVKSKEDVIASLLPYISASERARCVMVGDHQDDIRAAHAYHMPAIAVRYGFGKSEDLIACVPEYSVDSVAELHALLSGVSGGDG